MGRPPSGFLPPRHGVLRSLRSWSVLQRRWRSLLLVLALTAALVLVLLRSLLLPPSLAPGAACPPALVLVSNAKYLTRGNVGHWGYALFALHAALQDLPAKPASVTLFFDARVRTGDWVRTMVALLVSRHGIQISLAHTAPGHCARTAAVVARLDANDAVPLSAGQDDALRDAMQSVCQMEAQTVAVRRDVLIYNRHPQSTRRLCNLDEVVTALEERGLTHTYADVPSTACHQFAALAAPRRFTITPHGAHEVNLFATWPNASVIEVMPHLTDIPIYNRLVRRPVWVISERLTQPFKCVHGACQALPAHYGACTRNTLCRKFARNRPCVYANIQALGAVLDMGEQERSAHRRLEATSA